MFSSQRTHHLHCTGVTALVVVASLCFAAAAAGQQTLQVPADVEIPDGYTVVQHIIRPGDTFSSVTREYLGNAREWQLNQQLNPQSIERRLRPGDRMLVLIDPTQLPLTARVNRKSGQVQAQASPLGWLGAEDNDLLIEKDAARTQRDASAELLFHDGTSVVLTAESLVFIRQLGRGLSTVESNRTTQRVEIVEGQADLSSLAGGASNRNDVEIVMGSSTLTLPKESPIKTRTAIAESGASRVGVYQGNASFEASGGENVDLSEGEGLVAIANEAPKKETLLPAPAIATPTASEEVISTRRPRISWSSPGEGATSYTVEVCRDENCGHTIQRRTNVTGLSQAMPDLDAGDYFVRVTAASASGLDGYPETRKFKVIDLPNDTIAPRVAFEINEWGVPYNGLQAYSSDLPFTMSASDEGTGVERSGLVVNGSDQDQTSTIPTGRTTLAAFAIDQVGQRTETESVEVFIDSDPPRFEVAERDAPSFAERDKRPKSQRAIRKAKAKGVSFPPKTVLALNESEAIGFSIDGYEWRPLAALETGLITNSSEIQIAINQGFCIRSVSGQQWTGADRACGLTFLTVSTLDEHTGVKVLTASVVDDMLTLTSEDEVGNTATIQFRISGS